MKLQDWDELEPVMDCHGLEQARAVETCEYPRCLSSSGCEKQCPAFPRCKDADTGKTSDVPETNFGNMAQVDDSKKLDHVRDATKMVPTWRERCETHPDHKQGMVTNQMIMDRMQEEIDELRATIKENLKVDPVGYFSINSYGNWEQNESGYGTPLYEAPPKRDPEEWNK